MADQQEFKDIGSGDYLLGKSKATVNKLMLPTILCPWGHRFTPHFHSADSIQLCPPPHILITERTAMDSTSNCPCPGFEPSVLEF
eukprot:8205228-Ditylum_brightwellii.AAC.2